MQEEGFIEKRKYIRFDIDAEVNFQVLDKNRVTLETASALAKNLSIEGVCFISHKKLEPGRIIKLEIILPYQSRPLHLEGKIRWSHPIKNQEGKERFEVGVKLLIVEKSDETKFIRYVYDKMEQDIDKNHPRESQ